MTLLKTCIAVICLLLVKVQGQLILAGGRGKVQLELYQADRATLIGPMVDGMVIDLAKTPKLNIKGSGKSNFQNRRFSSMSFFIDGKLVRTDSTVPSWMLGDPDSAWTPTVGIHTIKAVGYRGNEGKGTKMLESLVSVKVIDSRTKTPTLAPLKASAPSLVAAPIAAPVVAPVAASVVAPATAPTVAPVMAAPVVAPVMVAPVAAPVAAPVTAPAIAPVVTVIVPTKLPVAKTKAPTERPTKAPTRRPTSSPTAAPTPCVSDIVKYINSITLSNHTLSVNGYTPLDFALLQLLVSNGRKGVRLSTCNEAGQKRLRQRYAYFALVFSTGVAGDVDFDFDDECSWEGLDCNVNGTVTELDLTSHDLAGSIPADVALWTAINYVYLGSNRLNGTLPSSIGAWTALTDFVISENQFQGQLPSSMGAWTRLASLDIYSNKFTGPLPTSIGGWWPDMVHFHASNNNFTGPLPASIGVWTNLEGFYVENNQFSGSLPKGVADWTSIFEVYIHGNSFSGPIPTIGTNYCPRTFFSGTLRADCLNETVCDCCNICCDADGSVCFFK
jgi:hypothetical protein